MDPIATPATNPAQAAAKPGATATPVTQPAPQPAAPEAVVFTTMPRGDGRQPTTSTASIAALSAPGATKSRVKLAIGVAVAVIVLAVGGVFAYSRIHKASVAQPTAVPGITHVPMPTPSGASPTPTPQSTQPQSKIPDAWRVKYFGAAVCSNQDVCGDSADPEQSGLTNLEAYTLNIDPNNGADDGCGLANGDVVHIFNLDPSSCHTGGNPKYTDVDDLKGHYNSRTGKLFTAAELTQIAASIKQYGLHTPTTATLDAATITFYTNYGQAATPTGASATGTGTALDRDTQRSTTISQISYALLKYQQTNGSFPSTSSFTQMFSSVQPLLAGQAINETDPTNVAPYVYTYLSVNSGADFSLTYYSETQSQAIVVNSALAQKNYAADQAKARDIKRQSDLQNIAGALQLYSNDNANPAAPTQHVYPTEANLAQALVPKYLTALPVDPSTGQPYAYSVSADNASFSIQAVLENPPVGKKGFLCTQDSCALY